MSAAWFGMSAEDVLRADAINWKKRALAAEAKLSGYRRLRECAEGVMAAVCGKDAVAKADAFDGLGEELATLEVVDKPRNPYDQIVELREDKKLIIRTKAGIGSCSSLDLKTLVLEVEALQPEEGKAVGLFFQILQLSDIAASNILGRKPCLDAAHLHALVPVLLALCADMGLLSNAVNITSASLSAYVVEAKKEDAASGNG